MPYSEDDQHVRAMEADQRDRLRYGGGYASPLGFMRQKSLSGKAQPPDMVIPEKRNRVSEDVTAIMEPPTKTASVCEPGPKPERQE